MDDDRQVRLEQKVDHIIEKISSIDSTLAAQHVSLDIHIKRSDMLEKQMEPIKKDVAMVHGALKFIGLISTLAVIAEAVLAVLNHKG